MKLLSFQLFLGLLLSLFLVRPIFAQEQYFFNEEFNEVRPPQTLNPDKWIVYPNRNPQADYLGCLVDTVTETGGLLILRQCSTNTQSPYIVSKVSPFPDGDFTATVRFQFPGARGFPTGIKFVDVAPENGGGATELFGIGFEEDVFQGFSIEYKDTVVYTKGTDSNYYIFKAVKADRIYKLYLNDQLVFTSPETTEKVHAIYIGSPVITEPLGYGWTFPRVDYIRVINDGPSETTPQPFLDLPWDYEANDMTFNEAATAINAYFDHEYPLLSTNLFESTETQSSVLSFLGGKRDQNLSYSGHDGYDYGSRTQTKLGTPQLAAAAGEASYLASCGACGNAIIIDHKNGFQTRYYHLEAEDLILNEEGKTISVTQGQQIGKVGYSGNVRPKKAEGSHIHFMIVQDKNNDGDFEDNIPDGLVDPFGWQSEGPDPWETYSFNYKGEQRTGSKSYYLFTKNLDSLNANLTSNQAVFNVGKTEISFPEGSTNENLTIHATTQPAHTGPQLNSLGSIINITAKNLAQESITTFLKNFSLTIDFSQFDLTRYKLNTLSIYSSQDGENWTKEQTQVNMQNKRASTSLNHLTYFALMGERADSTPPITTPVLQGEKGAGNNFRANTTLTLNAQDNEQGLGVEYTAWGYEDQPWQTYTDPIAFTEEGNYKIFFYSQDKDDNIEEIKSVEFSIDKTPPEAKIEVDKSLWDLKITPVSTDSAITKSPGKKPNEYNFILNNPSGNTLTLETYYINTKYIDFLKIYSLKYNNSPKTLLADNTLDTNYLFYTPKTKPEIKIVNQNFIYKNAVTFVILADALKQKTLLNILENGTRRKEEKPNLTLLKLQTNNGKLEYSY